jgi:hypothetical protein
MSKKTPAPSNFVTPLTFEIDRLVVEPVSTKKGKVPFEMVDLKYLYGPRKVEGPFTIKFARCFTFGVKESYLYLQPKIPANKTGDLEMTFVPYSQEWSKTPKEYDTACEKMNRQIIDKVRTTCGADENIPGKLRKELKRKLTEEDYVDVCVGGVAPMFSWQKVKREEGDKRKELPIDPTKPKMLNTKILRFKGKNGRPAKVLTVFQKPNLKPLNAMEIIDAMGDAVPAVVFEGYFVKGADKLCAQVKLNNVTWTEKAKNIIPIPCDADEFSDAEESEDEGSEEEGKGKQKEDSESEDEVGLD